MLRGLGLAVSVIAMAGLAACSPDPATDRAPTSSASNTTTATTPLSAPRIAEQLRAQIETVAQIVPITEDNDPNALIGRPNGYTDAAVIYDSGAQCPDLGIDCGATVEIWPDAAAAQRRADYIAGLQEASPLLGSEYHHLAGPVLLRVSGELVPSTDQRYAAAFSTAVR